MKYYGIKEKAKRDDFMRSYAQITTKVKGIIPGRYREQFKLNYKYIFEEDHYLREHTNGIPEGKFLELNQIVTSDLILREDIGKLQKGIRELLKKHRAGDRFIALPIEGLDEICSRIDQMDAALLSWYDGCKCGIFDFRNLALRTTIDYFSLKITNINSAYLGVEFRIYLTESKKKELEAIINSDYHEYRGFAKKMLTSPENGGAYSTYTLVHYNDSALKADQIFEWISCVEWEFYEELKKYLPLVLHNMGEIPPRIEVYYTDIDYRDDNSRFWDSLGVTKHQGQFIDERQKMFFDSRLSGRYEANAISDSRLIYIVKDDGIEVGQLKSVKDKAYYHIEEDAREYFRFLFLGILSRTTGKTIIRFKHKLDRIKLRRNKLKQILKMRYLFERAIDPYVRFERDDVWSESERKLGDNVYHDNMETLSKITHPFCITYKAFCNGKNSGARSINDAIAMLRKEFADKEEILQQLYDYRNSSKNLWLSFIMLIITAATLFFVVFPERTIWVADHIRAIWVLASGLL